MAISLPNQLKKAYETQNWGLVKSAYKMLTGVALDDIEPVSTEFPMEADEPDDDDVLDDIDLEDEPEPPKKKRGRPKKATVNHNSNSVVNPNRPNLFLDMIPSLKKDKRIQEAGKFDKAAVYTAKKSIRSRDSAKKISVTCAVCNGKFKVYKSELQSSIPGAKYRCNGCCGGSS